MKSREYYGGFLVGFGLIVILFVIVMVALRKRQPKPKFDERQIAARGKAFQTGFFALLIANAVGIILSTAEISWLSGIYVFAGASIVGVAVFGISAIKNDAYFAFNENKKASRLFIGAMGLLNLCAGVLHIAFDGILEDGELNTGVLSLLVAALSAVIVAASLIHDKKRIAAEEGEDA